MMQSSGMGKTKLMREYSRTINENKESDVECKMILCIGNMQEEPTDLWKHYDHKLKVQGDEGATAKGAKDISPSITNVRPISNNDRPIAIHVRPISINDKHGRR